MPSSEKMSAVTGRQYVAALKIPIKVEDFNAQADFFLSDLPQGAVITNGFISTDVAWTASTTFEVTVRDSASVVLDTILAASAVDATGLDNITVTGTEIAVSSEVTLTIAGATPVVGNSFIYLEYVVDGRQHFSEG